MRMYGASSLRHPVSIGQEFIVINFLNEKDTGLLSAGNLTSGIVKMERTQERDYQSAKGGMDLLLAAKAASPRWNWSQFACGLNTSLLWWRSEGESAREWRPGFEHEWLRNTLSAGFFFTTLLSWPPNVFSRNFLVKKSSWDVMLWKIYSVM